MSTAAEGHAPALHTQVPSNRALTRQLLYLSLPVMAEHVLHMLVGLTDTYLANHLPSDAPAAAAAVGTIAYLLWFIGLIVATVATGSTAIIARAVGARHRSLANSVCGQSVTSAVALGAVVGGLLYFGADWIADITQLKGQAREFALVYTRLLALSLPFSTLMFVANSCLRGAGDTVTPAISMIVVDVVNVVLSYGLTFGRWGLPALGFAGIAWGTVVAYVAGGLLQFAVLVHGRDGIRLHLHRLRPHWTTLKRILRIGVPSGVEGVLAWLANFGVVIVINHIDRAHDGNAQAAAHVNAIRIEAISYMAGFAVATAAATMVGQSLGMKNPRRAVRSAYLAYAVGGGMMVLCGLFFIFAGAWPARLLSANAQIADLTARCLFITGFIQAGFAASAILVRFAGVLIVVFGLGWQITGIWVVLSAELFLRGVWVYGRFLHGGWKHARV